ncbi:MAG: acylglycerol lipase [Thermoleophilaceae bacterium]|nr:acylglycerol lipase [Thermoleophilaceae bacterium]
MVVLAHGASEHGARYAWTGEQLAAHGFALYAGDHRGHGRSSGPRAYVDRMDNVVADLDRVIDLAHAANPGTKTFLLGHSMGGAVALSYAIEHQERLDGLILSAPAASLEAADPLTRLAGRALSLLLPKVGVFPIDSSGVSRDPEVVRDYDADPLNYHGKLPARTVAELSDAIGSYPENVARLTLPLLTMHGTADRITPPQGSEMIMERAGSEDKSIIRYDGLFHELLNEPERQRVLDDIVAWIEARLEAS